MGQCTLCLFSDRYEAQFEISVTTDIPRSLEADGAASFKCNTWVALHWGSHTGPTLGRKTLLGRQPLESLTPSFAE